MRAIPDYGDTMTVEEFSDLVRDGSITQCDGTGYFANPPLMEEYEHSLDCQEIYNGHVKLGFTHVVWFNK